MKTIVKIISAVILVLNVNLILAQGVAINADGSQASSDAILHLKSTNKGLIVPSMTTSQRTSITNTSNGLLVYDTQTNSFWFRDSGTWNEIASGDIDASLIQDNDGDTQIQVEENNDEDIIRFDIKGNQQLAFRTNSNGNLMIDLSTNSFNTFIGRNAGLANEPSTSAPEGKWNTFIGYDAGSSNTTGIYNTFLGRAAGSNVTDGLRNTNIGASAGQSNTSGENNTFIGTFSGQNINAGNNNTYIGYASASLKSSGNNNTFLGFEAGKLNSTGSHNVFIGNQAGFSAVGSNQLYIDNNGSSNPLIYGEFNNDLLRVNGELEVTSDLEITSDATSTPSAGHVYSNSGPLAYGYISNSGSITTDYGINSVTKTATGVYEITLDNSFTVNPVVMVTPYTTISGAAYTSTYWALFPNKITVNIVNESGLAEDQPFSIVVMGW